MKRQVDNQHQAYKLGIISLGVILLTLFGSAWAAESSKEFEQTLSVDTPLILDIQTASGDIQISQSEDGLVHIRGLVTVTALLGGQAERTANQIIEDLPIVVEGNRIKVGNLRKYGITNRILNSISISYEVLVPYEADVIMDSSSGNLMLQNLQGPVSADASSGDISISNVQGAVNADTSSGNINLNDITGDVQADASSGDVSINNVQGAVNADTSSGFIKLSNIAGDVQADVSSGDVSVTNIQANLVVDATSGLIEVNSAIAESVRWSLSASSGNITLLLPEGSSFNLQAEASSGEISFGDFALEGNVNDDEVKGSVGENPSANIRIEASSGNIVLKER